MKISGKMKERGILMIVDMSLEVLGSDTDQNGHMNHVRYISYLEQARHTWYNGIGMPVRTLIEQEQIGTAVVHLETDFKKEARAGDQLVIRTTLTRVGTKSFTLHQVILNEETILVEATIVSVMFDLKARKAIPVHDKIKEAQFK